MLYETAKPVVRVALTWYYRSIAVARLERVPETGPVFLAVNHPNALVDALVVAGMLPRRVHFTAKATIFANPIVAAFLHRAGVIPLRRAADEKREAARTETDPARNADSFRAVGDALARGSAVVIFPEGRSHDESQLAPLRTGLARMALMAREAQGVRGIRIAPIGLLFERKEEPRSRVLLQVGDVIDLDAFVAALPDATHAVERLTALVAERLAAITVNFESRSDAERISVASTALAHLLEPTVELGDDGPSLSAVLSLVRRADRVRAAVAREASVRDASERDASERDASERDASERGASAHDARSHDARPRKADAPARATQRTTPAALATRVAAFETRLQTFRDRLASAHVAIADIGIDPTTKPGAQFVVRETLLALALVPVSLWGRVTHVVPIRLARWLALRNAKNRDEPAMNTLVIGTALVLLAYAVETGFVWWLVGPWWAAAFFATLIPSAGSDLRYGDRVRRRTERMHTYLAFRRNPALQGELLAEADWLRREAGAIEQMAIEQRAHDQPALAG